MKTVYFDNSATTPLSPLARDTFLRVSTESWGNASSLHTVGLRAHEILEKARLTLRRALGGTGGKILFTGSGSEANNLAIFGRAFAKPRFRRGGRILTTLGEHASVAMPLAALRKEGFDVVELPTRGGQIDLAALEDALTPEVFLVSVMTVNNETGARYDLRSLRACMQERAPQAVLHTDATQAFGKIPLRAAESGWDMVTVSAHKIGGPQGCGALWVSDSLLRNKGLVPFVLGGGQEEGFRSGTENIPGCAAFAAAAEEADRLLPSRAAQMQRLSERLLSRLPDLPGAPGLHPNLPPCRAPHILSLTLPDIKSETMLHFLSARGFCIANGSACSSHGRHAPAPLLAFGLTGREADCTVRISFSHENTDEEVDLFCDALREGLDSLARIR